MSSVEYKKKDCFASGTLSSASMKGTFTKIQRRKVKARKRPSAKSLEDTESDCEICRCSVSTGVASSRTVRRILTACVISFLSLLGSVSVDLSANMELWRTTQDAFQEFTSCRTNIILGLVGALQNERSRCTAAGSGDMSEPGTCILTTSDVPYLVIQICKEMQVRNDGQGLPCDDKLTQFCVEIKDDIVMFMDATQRAGNTDVDNVTYLSLSILRVLRFWGDLEKDIGKVRQNVDWANVLSLRQLVIFKELNYQLNESPLLVHETSFQNSWHHSLSGLIFGKLQSEAFHKCWIQNASPRLNSTQQWFNDLVLLPWVNSASISPAVPPFADILVDIQDCLLEKGGQTLQRKSRDFLSSLSLKFCLLAIACLIYPIVLLSFKQMTEWIQNYAQSLRDRTEDLKQQRRLAEDLLHQMLPKSVAKQLRQQKHVKAESYEKARHSLSTRAQPSQ
ncbi:uncharacterized protein LOC135233876 isoform X1 [Anguilla rostrata]|uniref:uncharacterized protein LOC135233876 isoform X1 n=1 Tax=Anguilla rostrata TaxID=7938 RepID=UPI0030D36C10